MKRLAARAALLALVSPLWCFAPSSARAPDNAPPSTPAEVPAQAYFAIGSWRIGMTRDDALGHFKDVQPLDPPGRYRATAESLFGVVPAVLSFADDRLQTVELTFYEGNDREAALQSLLAVLKKMHEEFGGSNLEGGLKYQRDPQGELMRNVIDRMINTVDGSLAKNARKMRDKKDPTSYTLVFNYSTDKQARDNFLYGQYVLDRDLDRIRVKMWEDRAFVESRIPSTIYLRPRSQAPE